MTTPTLTGTDRWYQMGSALVTQTRASLTASVARSGMVPGDIAWDDCNCDGLLAVTVPRIYRSEVFPEEADAPISTQCQAPYEVAEYTVSVIRCAPQPDGQNLAPAVADLDAAAGLLLQDMTEALAGLQAYLCGLARADVIDFFTVSPAESVGPEGACVGFTLRVRIGLAT